MADPVTLGIVLVAAAATTEAISDIRQGQTESAVEKYNAKVAEAQAGTVQTSAVFESETLKQQSAFEQAKTLRAKKLAESSQRALYAKAGVRLDEGSPLEVMADTAAQFELDLAANRYNLGIGLEKTRYESQVKQSQLGAEAEYRRQLAKAKKTASYLKAGSTLLTGGLDIAGKLPKATTKG